VALFCHGGFQSSSQHDFDLGSNGTGDGCGCERAEEAGGCGPVQCFPGPVVELPGDEIQFRRGVLVQVGAFGEVMTQEAVGVFIARTLPRAPRGAEVHGHVQRLGEVSVLGHLLALIPRQRSAKLWWEASERPSDGVADAFRASVAAQVQEGVACEKVKYPTLE